MSTSQTNGPGKPLKVAVVGGGMCGLAVAIGLTRGGIDVDIYESAAKLGEFGAGVGLGPNAIRVLKELDILTEVEAAVYPEKLAPLWARNMHGTGDHEVIYDYPVGPNDDGLSIHRAVFLDALVHLVDASRIHCNKRCVDLREISPQRMQIQFSDGTTAEADVVIGADGVRSVVRTYVVEGELNKEGSVEVNGTEESRSGPRIVRAKFTNHSAYRGLVPVEELKKIGVKIDLTTGLNRFIGECKHVLAFPIKNKTVINVVAFNYDSSVPWGGKPIPPGTPWVTPRTKEELLGIYEGWSEDVRLLLSCIERPSVWSVHAIDPPLDSYIRGRVALVGDSAHAMLPFLGAGAGQGLEDALFIVRLLTHPQTRADNVQEVLKAYDTFRPQRANMVLARSTLMGFIYNALGHSGATKEGIAKDLEGKHEEIWHYDLLKDISAAVDQLQRAGTFTE